MCGLKQKLLLPEFHNYIKQYDIVCLAETKLCDLDSIVIDGYDIFIKNRSRFKRKSGGITCIVNKQILHCVEYKTAQKKYGISLSKKKII